MLKRRVVSFILAICTMLAFTCTALAEEGIEPYGANIPTTEIYLPGDSDTFDYTVGSSYPYLQYYSDFLIVPTTGTTNIRYSYNSTSGDHTIKIELYDVQNSRTPVVSRTVLNSSAVKNSQFTFDYLQPNHGYYIKITAVSAGQNYTGHFRVY